jgi:hypothetical protein
MIQFLCVFYRMMKKLQGYECLSAARGEEGASSAMQPCRAARLLCSEAPMRLGCHRAGGNGLLGGV